ncbi:MAG: ABC transporter permease [Pseudomonadota bacterium]
MDLLSFGDTGWGDNMLRGAGVTILLAVGSYLFGIIVGMGAAAMKLSHSLLLRTIAAIYTTVVRGVPELLVIYLLFYGSAPLIIDLASLFGYTGYFEIPPFLAGLVAVGLISGAYSTEVLRGAMQVIPAGQIEAGQSIGLSKRQVFFRIKLPQLWRFALPGLGNVWQLTLKDTALVSVISLAELMRVSRVAGDSEREPFVFYMAAGVLYLIMTTFSQAIFQRSEKAASRGVRRA